MPPGLRTCWVSSCMRCCCQGTATAAKRSPQANSSSQALVWVGGIGQDSRWRWVVQSPIVWLTGKVHKTWAVMQQVVAVAAGRRVVDNLALSSVLGCGCVCLAKRVSTIGAYKQRLQPALQADCSRCQPFAAAAGGQRSSNSSTWHMWHACWAHRPRMHESGLQQCAGQELRVILRSLHGVHGADALAKRQKFGGSRPASASSARCRHPSAA